MATWKSTAWGVARWVARRWAEQADLASEPDYALGGFSLGAYIYDPHTAQKKAVYGLTAGSPLVSAEWEHLETGCGAFSLVISARPDELAIERGDRVDLHLLGDPNPWFSGKVHELPAVKTGEGVYKFRGHGYFADLEHVLVTEDYSAQSINDVIQDLIASYLGVEIGWRSDSLETIGYTVTGASFDRTTLKDALTRLAELAGLYSVRVTEDRLLEIEPAPTRPTAGWANKESLWVGHHAESLELSEDADNVANVLHVKAGRVSSKSNFLADAIKSLDSIAFFGERHAEASCPELDNDTDAAAWAEQQLEERAWPQIKGKCKGVRIVGRMTSREDQLKADRYIRVSLSRSGLAAPYYEPLNGRFRWASNYYADLYGANWLKTEFTCRKSGLLGRVAFMIKRVGSPGALQVRVLSGATVVKTLSVAEADIQDWQAWVFVDCGSDQLVERGAVYALELSAASGDSSNLYQVLYSTYDAPYSGAYYSSPDSGANWGEDTGRGIAFRAWLGHEDEYSLQIKRAAYKAAADGGLTVDLDLGGIERPLEDAYMRLLREQRQERLLARANLEALS